MSGGPPACAHAQKCKVLSFLPIFSLSLSLYLRSGFFLKKKKKKERERYVCTYIHTYIRTYIHRRSPSSWLAAAQPGVQVPCSYALLGSSSSWQRTRWPAPLPGCSATMLAASTGLPRASAVALGHEGVAHAMKHTARESVFAHATVAQVYMHTYIHTYIRAYTHVCVCGHGGGELRVGVSDGHGLGGFVTRVTCAYSCGQSRGLWCLRRKPVGR